MFSKVSQTRSTDVYTHVLNDCLMQTTQVASDKHNPKWQ